jgi:hypothetical protein
MAALFPPVKWAQRAESLIVTLDIPDVDKKACQITLGPKELSFTGKSNGKDYSVKLEFLHEIEDKAEDTKFQVTFYADLFCFIAYSRVSPFAWGYLGDDLQSIPICFRPVSEESLHV